MQIALYQPDIAGNVGTILRTAACFGIGCDIIEPCGFPLGDRTLKRAALDYGAHARITRHDDWAAFLTAIRPGQRLILLTNRGETALEETGFQTDDIILMGSETAGVPPHVHDRADVRAHIPMQPGFRSINVAVAAGIAMAEALRQTGALPSAADQPTKETT